MSKLWIITMVLYFLCNHCFADDCNFDTIYHYQFSSDLAPKINEGREIIKYNSNQEKTELLYQVWDRNKNIWQNLNFNTYTYNLNGNITVDINQGWDLVSGKWINNFMINYTYNGNNNLTEEIFQSWDNETNQWTATSKELYSYNEHKFKTEHLSLYLYPNNPIWSKTQIVTYTYDSIYNLIEELNQVWTSNQLKNKYKINYTYNSNRLTYYTFKHWNGDEFKSVNDLEYYYTYDGSLLVELLTKQRGLWTDIFSDIKKETYNYNSGNELIELFKETNTMSGWIKDERYINTYNSGGCLIASDLYYYGDKFLQDYTTRFRDEFKFGTATSTLPSGFSEPTVKIYPNPAFYKITVEAPGGKGDFSIYNIHGQLVHSGVSDSNIFDIDIQNLTSGIYALHLFFEDKPLKAMIIKQ